MSLQFPSSPTTGQVFPSPLVPGAPSWFFDGTKWVSGGFSGAVVSTSPMPPLNPRVGDLWFDPQEGQTYVWFDDGVTKQWVIAVNLSALSTPTVLDQPQLNQPRIMGVTDGSSAAPGEVGEFVTATVTTAVAIGAGATGNIASIMLSPGDWSAAGAVNFSSLGTGAAQLISDVSSTSATYSGFSARLQSVGSVLASPTILLTRQRRFNLSSSTNIYLVASPNVAAQANGELWARRMR